ncbi:hypothetical protein BVX97_05495, partial [bacterium E08(2017)]
MTENEENISVLKKWFVASRPFSYPASITPCLLGAALAHYAGNDINWLFFILTVLGMVCFHAVGNLLNDVYD